ncbi:MAG: insulinase family protein, partial [Proteobacteria bacterium]|nr:insulinase family protein [Pseudomonadota bacterium]
MTIEVSRLNNGFTVATDRMDHVETAAVGVWVGIGARHETPQLNGVSHMLEHMAFKGTARRSAQEIVNQVESVGGQINAYTSRENTAYYLRVLAVDVGLAGALRADILQNSTFEAEDL